MCANLTINFKFYYLAVFPLKTRRAFTLKNQLLFSFNKLSKDRSAFYIGVFVVSIFTAETQRTQRLFFFSLR